MNSQEMQQFVWKCSVEDLRALEQMVAERRREIDATYSKMSEEMGRQQRREERFEVNYIGTLVRLTDVKPGERKEYSVLIKDISKSGMCLRVDSNFIPCRLVEVVFNVPGGKVKKCQLTIIRMQKRETKDGAWLELGCQSVEKEEVLRVKWQEQHFVELHHKLKNTGRLRVLVAGKADETVKRMLETRSASQRYEVQYVHSLTKVISEIRENPADLLIFSESTRWALEPDFKGFVESVSGATATLVMISREEDRGVLQKAGVDECLNGKDCEEFLYRAMERALVGKTAKASQQKKLSGRVLIISNHSSKINLLTFYLEDNGFILYVANTLDEAGQYLSNSVDAVFADFHPHARDEFNAVCRQFSEIPIIAICDEIFYGHEAIACGATNWMAMPFNQEDFRMIKKQIMAYNMQ